MPSDFFERIEELQDRVGDGTLTGKVEVDQVYARYQHEGLDFRHPRGGQAKYLEQPFLAGASGHMQTLARTVLEPDGPHRGMKDVVENTAHDVFVHAPVEFDNLRRSGHPSVEDNGSVVYDRPPEVPRLTEEQLREEKRRARRVARYAREQQAHIDRIGGLE